MKQIIDVVKLIDNYEHDSVFPFNYLISAQYYPFSPFNSIRKI